MLSDRRLPAYGISAKLVRADGIEPTSPVWKTGVLPLNYARSELKPKLKYFLILCVKTIFKID